jgi:putative membrane protein
MKRFVHSMMFVLPAVGIAVIAMLLAHYGAGEILLAVAATGWGLLIVTAFHLVPMALDTFAWSVLLPRGQSPGFARLLAMRWVGESVNFLVPSAQVGGDIVRAHLLRRAGIPGSTAAASVLVNLTLMVVTLFVFCLAGAGGLLAYLQPAGGSIALPGLVLLAVCMTFAFVALQRAGICGALAGLAARLLPARDLSGLSAGAGRLDEALRESWRRLGRVGTSAGLSLAAWFAGSGEIWLILYFLGHPVGWFEAFLLECLFQAVRNGAFFVPGAVGIQEAGAVLFGGLFGLAPESSLALSLLKRSRELLLGVPGVLAWQLWHGAAMLPAGRRQQSPVPVESR